MKKLLLVFLCVASLTTISFGQDASPTSCELASVIQVDGISTEWPMDWKVDDDKIFSYNICTDANNIYIRVKTDDPLAKRKMAHFGFTVWMDPNGKKKRKLGLRFPTGVEAKERMDAFKASGQDKREMTAVERDSAQKKLDRTSIENLEVLELIGLADDPLTSTRSGITNGLKVAITTEGKGYTYEAVIPFKSFRLSKSSISTLGIGFETGKFIPPPIKNSASSQGPPPGGAGAGGRGGYGGGGGGYGGGYGGGGYGGSGGRSRSVGNNGYRSSPMMVSTSAWTSVKLK